MKKNNLIYRYRTGEEHTIIAFQNDWISGTLFSKFAKFGEANYCVSDDFKRRNCVTDKEAFNLVQKATENHLNHYYLASFTRNKPNSKSEEWIKYSCKKGFCLVYDNASISLAIKKAVLFYNKIVSKVEVVYSDKPFSLDFYIKKLLLLIKEHNIKTEEELDLCFSEHPYDKEFAKTCVKAFGYKSSEYKRFNEMRVVMQGKNNCPMYVDEIIKVSPVLLIIPMPFQISTHARLVAIAQQKKIEVVYLNVDWSFLGDAYSKKQ